MSYTLLLVILFSPSLLTAMEHNKTSAQTPPQQQQMIYSASPLTDMMPPMRMTMEEYEKVPGTNWFHTRKEIEEFRDAFTQHPLYQEMCLDPIKHAELIDSVATEASLRICAHVGSGCITILKPCTPALFSLFFAWRATTLVQTGECCKGCLNTSLGCVLAMASCGRCSKSVKAMRGITKTTHKTYTARELFNHLRTTPTNNLADLEDKKNK